MDHACDGGKQTGEHESDQLYVLGLDAGEMGRGGIASGGIDLAAETGLAHDDPEDHKQGQEDDGRYRHHAAQAHAQHFKFRCCKALTHAVGQRNTRAAGPQSCKATGDVHRRQRYDESLYLHAGNDKSVEQAVCCADDQANQHRGHKAQSVMDHQCCRTCGYQADHRTYGEVDIAQEDNHRHADGKDTGF